MKQKLNWTKLPSVTREGKFFYRTTIHGKPYTLLQSWLTGLWGFDTYPEFGDFKTARMAQDFVEKNLTGGALRA